MHFNPLEITTPHIIYALLGAFVVLFGMFSLLLREKLYIGEAIWAFAFGVIMGPFGANIFNPRAWGNSSNPGEPIDVITIEFTRVVLAIGVFAIGVELPKAYMVKHWKSLFFLLVPGMTWGWFVCAGLIYALIPGLNFLSSLAVSACLTPTDPILASAVVGGKWADKHVPAHIRHLLAAESGCNDGAAFPFLFFALYLMTELPSVGNAMRDWFVILWLYQVILGTLIGSVLGFSFRYLMIFCQRHDWIDRHSYVAQYLSLAILTTGLATLLGCDDLLAAFACGTSFAWDGFFNKQTEESVFSSVIDTLFNVAAFIFVGAWMPFGQFHVHVQSGTDAMGAVQVWRLVVLAILVLLLRRLPIMMAMYRWIPDVKTWREAVFSGHFGPMGIGAIFISTYATQFLVHHIDGNPSTTAGQQHQLEMVSQMIQPIVAFMVLCSITIHGLSIPGFSLGRRVHSVSRTWSRRDTTGSRAGAPDWTNQARLVTRAEDIVINRDLEKGDEGRGGVPLEKTMTMMSTRTLNNGEDGQKDDDDSLKSDAITEERSPIPASNAPQDDCRNQFPPDGKHNQTREWMEGDQRVIERNMGGPGDDVEVTMIDEPPHADKKHRDLGHSKRDGVKEFHLGKRRTAGSMSARDVDDRRMRPTTADTLVAHEERDKPWVLDAIYYPEEKAGVAAAESGQGLAMGDTANTTASGPALETQEHKTRSSSLSRLPPQNQEALSRRITQIPDTTVNLNLDTDYPVHLHEDYDSDNGNNNADNEIQEVPRGRESRLGMSTNKLRPAFRRTMSGSSLMSGPVLRMAEIPSSTPPPTFSPRSSILPSIFPPLNIPLSHSPHSQPGSRSRPRTAPTVSTISPSPLASVPTSRPGTSDSTGSIRHHRLDSIRGTTISHGHVQGHRTPPTRDSSPSRSVRFVDYVDGESGHVGPFGPVGGSSGSGNDNEGKKVPVVDIPPPPLPTSSRSSSFYRDGNGNGRTLVGSLVEIEGPAASASGSVATTVASRPPTR